MIGIDTNVLVRYLVRDDEAQFTKARALIRRETAAGRRILISLVVLLETFADCLIGVHYRRLGCDATVTFHTKTSSLAGFVLA